ncbi:hypothetical protein OKW45_006643 [Paraburkholderia sp. WSM4175]|uniref:hypothetical protein n=1 Tax=Paraburkholderia sp. WSM4175 TaxID=2991072 RepID=UPI003D1C600A
MAGPHDEQPHEYVGNWSDGTTAPVVIARAGDGVDITQTGQTGDLHGQYKDGAIRVTSKNASVIFACDKWQDVINSVGGGFPLGMLRRMK